MSIQSNYSSLVVISIMVKQIITYCNVNIDLFNNNFTNYIKFINKCTLFIIMNSQKINLHSALCCLLMF